MIIVTSICSHCDRVQPAGATFCPFCGTATGTAADATPTEILEPVPQTAEMPTVGGFDTLSIEKFAARRRNRGLLAAALGIVTAATIAAGLWTGAWLSAHLPESKAIQAAPARVAPPQKQKSDEGIVPLILMVQTAPGGFDIVSGKDVVHQIRTVEGSRYKTLEERQRAVTVRLDHIADKTTGRFQAQAAGDHYEVVWSDGSTSFRICDVTKADAAQYFSDSIDIVANLVADRMNAATSRPAPGVSDASPTRNERPS